MVAGLASNRELALAALLNTTGLPYETRLEVKEDEIPYQPYRAHLGEMITQAYQFNPDWNKLKAGLGAAEARILETRSGYLPKVLLTGSLVHLDNSYNQGIVTPNNKDNWTRPRPKMNRPGAAPTWGQNVKAGSQVIFYVLIFALLSQLSSAAAGGQGEAASRLSGLRIPYKASSLPWITST